MNGLVSYRSVRMDKFRPGLLRLILRMVAGFVFVVISGNVLAQYNGHNLRGDYGMFSGTQPGLGWYVGVLGMNYDVDSLRDFSKSFSWC
jgi:hypothetical protein